MKKLFAMTAAVLLLRKLVRKLRRRRKVLD